MTQINGTKIGRTVNISLGGNLTKKTCATPEMADQLFKLILDARVNPSEENIMKIKGFLNDKTRIAMECGLETDPQNGLVFLAGFNTPVSMTLVEVIKDYYDNDYPMDAIINFWKLLMLNPDTRIRETLFDFIKTHDFVLTDNGYMVVYKAVYYAEDKKSVNLAEFISKNYLHVKKDWSCSAKKYIVYRKLNDGSFHITKKITAESWDEKERGVEILGNLGTMHDNLDDYIVESKTPYTDIYTRTMKIGLGMPIQMERKDCDSNPTNDCSYGLHVGATKYVETYANNASAILVCYVNPANVVAVPECNHSKMRVSEYFPFAIAEYDGGKIDIIEQSYFESDYTQYEAEDLNKMVENIQANELPIETQRTNCDIEEKRSFDELQKIIEGRLIDISQ